MIAGLIFVISSLTLLQFFVSYSRSLIAVSRGHQLSEQACEICGFTPGTVAGSHFWRLIQLIAMCPDPGGDQAQVRAISLYFRLLGAARALLGWAIPASAPWIESERGGCAYVAAVALDRRIAYNRMLMAQQASH